ncbi:hypothetical protein Y032_0029g1891 [Ancylostoma ceylanicum]|uniref:Uncharacterized protein n=1 Tax=Ancylostoma ceylanicum TaxID=53326 RepID=A0A016USB1_9BILA|nr:hypothetical protein Y032_0029g1891 [Ancylostoma ceylanicum]
MFAKKILSEGNCDQDKFSVSKGTAIVVEGITSCTNFLHRILFIITFRYDDYNSKGAFLYVYIRYPVSVIQSFLAYPSSAPLSG